MSDPRPRPSSRRAKAGGTPDLPASGVSAAEVQEASPAASVVRVLIADDAEQLRGLLARALAKDPRIEVVGEASDGRAAVQISADLKPDVLLLDLSMPILDGLEVIRLVNENDPGIRILVFSGYGTSHLGDTCKRLGASGYLEKGVEMATLRESVLKVHESGSLW